MVNIEGKVSNTTISILVDPGACRSYVSPNIVKRCKLEKFKHETIVGTVSNGYETKGF